MAVHVAMSSFPPPASPASRSTSPPSITVNNGSNGGISKVRQESQPAVFVKTFTLMDFKDFTYRDMVDKVGLLLGAIQENRQLQLSLLTIVNGSNFDGNMSSILQYCKKAGGLLGHRSEYITDSVDVVFTTLTTKSIPQRVKEIQALQLTCEAILDFPQDMVTKMLSLSNDQRQRLLLQFQSTPLGSSQHNFSNKGAWVDPELRPLLEQCNYSLVNGRLSFRRNTKSNKDIVRSGTLALLALKIINGQYEY